MDKQTHIKNEKTSPRAREGVGTVASEAVYKALVDHVPDILGLVGADGNFRFVSSPVLNLTGHHPEDLIGRNFIEFVHPDDGVMASHVFGRIILNPCMQPATEIRFRKLDGSYIPLEILARNHLDDPAIQGIVVSGRDITERKRAREDLRQSEFLIERGLQDTIAAVAATIDARDPYTSGHQIRVADIARKIAAEIGVSASVERGVVLAATIHDLGKIKIPAEILSTSRRLTPIEYELIKTHAEAGYEILKDVSFPWPIAEIVRQHHEQIDGTGYPRGLRDDQILLEAKIIAVADTVEAMAANRPYRTSLGLDAALKEISIKRGTSYCPVIVDACLKIFSEGYQLLGK